MAAGGKGKVPPWQARRASRAPTRALAELRHGRGELRRLLDALGIPAPLAAAERDGVVSLTSRRAQRAARARWERPRRMRRRMPEPAAGDLRAEVAARIRERYGDLWRRQGGAGDPPASWVGRAAQLEAGEPVRVASWELPREHPAAGGTCWYTLEPDGSLTALE